MIMPLFDYSFFLLLSCNKSDKEDVEIIQNNVLRLCPGLRSNDMISLIDIHKERGLPLIMYASRGQR